MLLNGVFSVDLVFKEELNLMLKVAELIPFLRNLDLQRLMDYQRPKLPLALGPFNLSRNKKSLEIYENFFTPKVHCNNLTSNLRE